MFFRINFLLALILLAGCELQNLRTDKTDLNALIEVDKRANAAYQAEDWVTAEKEYFYLTQNAPSESVPWFRLGNIYARTDRLDAAVNMYRQALTRDSVNGKIWHNLGIVQLRLATKTFIEMVNLTEEGDPLNTRGKQVVNSVTNLMSTNFE